MKKLFLMLTLLVLPLTTLGSIDFEKAMDIERYQNSQLTQPKDPRVYYHTIPPFSTLEDLINRFIQKHTTMTDEEIKSKVTAEIKILIQKTKMIADEKLNGDAQRHAELECKNFITDFSYKLEKAYKNQDHKAIERLEHANKQMLLNLKNFVNEQNQ